MLGHGSLRISDVQLIQLARKQLKYNKGRPQKKSSTRVGGEVKALIFLTLVKKPVFGPKKSNFRRKLRDSA